MALATMPDFGNKLRITGVSAITTDLDAENEQHAWIFQVPKSGSITLCKFVVNTKTTNGTLTGRLETIDGATGLPSGSAYGGCAAGTVAVTAAGVQTITFATPATATAGDVVALVLTQDATGDMLILRGHESALQYMPVVAQKVNAGSWAKAIASMPQFIVGYSDGSFPYIKGAEGFLGETFMGWFAYAANDDPDEYGLRFVAPGPLVLSGAWVFCRIVAGEDVKLALYDHVTPATAEITSFTMDGDTYGTGTTTVWHCLTFASPPTLTSGAAYILSLQPQGNTDIRIYRGRCVDADQMEATSGGETSYAVSRVNAGNWTSITDYQPYIVPIFSQIDDGAGGRTSYILGVS